MRIYLRFAFVIARACLRGIQSVLAGSLVSLCLLPDCSANRRKKFHFISVCFVDDVVRCVWRLPFRQRLICL